MQLEPRIRLHQLFGLIADAFLYSVFLVLLSRFTRVSPSSLIISLSFKPVKDMRLLEYRKPSVTETFLQVDSPLFVTIKISYAQLSNRYDEYLRTLEKSKQDIKNSRSALSAWIRCFNLTGHSYVSDELTVLFEKRISDYIDYQEKLGISPSTYRSRISHLRALKIYYLNELENTFLPPAFHERLSFFVKSQGYSCSGFWRCYLQSAISKKTFILWCTGKKHPSNSRISVVESVEKYLDLKTGVLTEALVRSTTHSHLRTAAPVQSSAASERFKQNLKKPYVVLSARLEAELLKLEKFKTEPILEDGLHRLTGAEWTRIEGTLLTSAQVNKNQLKSFFGYLCLPKDSADPELRGQGMSADELSFAHLTDKSFVESYITKFKKARAGGIYHGGSLRFLQSVCSLLHERGGYITQTPRLAAEIGLKVDAAEWKKRCAETHQRLRLVIKQIENAKAAGSPEFGKGRDSTFPIKNLLKLPRPLEPVTEMVQRMLIDSRKLPETSLERAILFRNALLVALLQANPLRARHYSIMEFDKHLVREPDSSWWIEFGKNEFKNRRFLKGDYRVQVMPEIWQMIDEYRSCYRPRILGADVSNYVFVRIRKKDKNSPHRRMTAMNLSYTVFEQTRLYLPESPGFRCHAVRHLVASDIIKANPGVGFFLASIVLHDSLKMVENTYAHLRTSDYFQPYNVHLGNLWNKVSSGMKMTGANLTSGNQNPFAFEDQGGQS